MAYHVADSLGHDDLELFYYLGDLFQAQNEFTIAKGYFNKYLQNIDKDSRKNPTSLTQVKKRISECEFGETYKSESKQVEIVNLGNTINSEYPDYAPVISADEQTLFFTSRRPNSTGGLVDAADGWNMEDIYICVKDSLNNWSAPEQMPGYINSRGHDANIGLSPDGQKLFIYRDDELEEGLAGNIYSSDWKFKRWSTPLLMPEPVNSPYWETGISITPDEKTMYFSSNRPGGYGGLDIYSVKALPNGDWALPENLGPKINTAYNEESPFIHPDGKTLYFSSEGHSSMGGFDVFFSSLEDSIWTNPINMGYPINTAQNELYFVLSADARRGYFSGVRSETFGDKDIYVANLPERPVQIILLKGQVVDKDDGRPLATFIKVYDNASKELIYVLNSNGVNGRFSSVLPPHKNYNVQIEVEQPGYSLYSVNIHIPDQKEFVEIDTLIELQKEGEYGVITLLPNIFFQLNIEELDSTSELELDALAARLFKNPKLNLEIAVHTFSQKDKDENKLLSQKRADAIKQALVDRGINENRIFPVGYGSSFPLEGEKVAWKEKGILPDDRVEAITIPPTEESRDPDKDGYYYLNFEPFELMEIPEEEPLLIASENQYNDTPAKEDGLIEEKTVKSKEKVDLPDLSDLFVYFIVNKIYFRIDPDSVLDQIVIMMDQTPEMILKVNCYTDTIGHPDYNIFLSQIRAENVKKALVKKGANADRILTKGHGEINPRFSNATLEGRRKNRRAEFEAVDNKN